MSFAIAIIATTLYDQRIDASGMAPQPAPFRQASAQAEEILASTIPARA